MNKMVLIEYTTNHDANAGLVGEDDKAFTIEDGTRRYVDAASARSLVVKKKVAKYVTDEELAAEKADAAKTSDEDLAVEKPADEKKATSAKAQSAKPEGVN